jgi:hypothetical protein
MDVVLSRRAKYIAAAAGLLALTALGASSCSSKSGSPVFGGTDDGGGSGGDDSGFGASSSGAGSSSGTGSSSGFNLGDAGAGGMGNGTCKDGTYAGMYACSFVVGPDCSDAGDAGFNDGGFVITGNISFQLAQDQSSGESFLDKASGSFGGGCCAIIPGMPTFSLDAGVSGQLNCNSGEFMGMLSNGSYTGFGMTGTFGGPLNSQYNGANSAFVDGKWQLTVPGQGCCTGIWSANLQ